MQKAVDIQSAIDQLQIDIARARGEARAAQTFAVMVGNYLLQIVDDPNAVFNDLERVLKTASIPTANLSPTLDAADIAYMNGLQSALAELRRQSFPEQQP